jgi:hypothetical protein
LLQNPSRGLEMSSKWYAPQNRVGQKNGMKSLYDQERILRLSLDVQKSGGRECVQELYFRVC